ncbi:hypothetical protein BCR36DRAFT_280267, partial [Piromyces finnis]
LKIKAKNNTLNILKETYLNIKLKINDCSRDSIKVIDSNNFYTCELPNCNDNCLIGNKKCIKPENIHMNVNDPNINVCVCLAGYTGNDCLTLDYGPEK